MEQEASTREPGVVSLEEAWVNVALAEGAPAVLEQIRRQGYVGQSPFVAANYDPVKAAVIEGKQQLAAFILGSIHKSFAKAGEPLPGAIREKLQINS